MYNVRNFSFCPVNDVLSRVECWSDDDDYEDELEIECEERFESEEVVESELAEVESGCPESDAEVGVSEGEKQFLKLTPSEFVVRRVNVFWFGPVVDEVTEDFLSYVQSRQHYIPFDDDYEVLVKLYRNGVYYVVYSRFMRSSIGLRLTDESVRRIVMSMRLSRCEEGLFDVASSELVLRDKCVRDKDHVVAQGGGCEYVRPGDKKLPESVLLVPSSTDNEGVNVTWTDKTERLMLSELVPVFPALYCYDGNYCDECGGVDMCKHILAEIVGTIDVDLAGHLDLSVKYAYCLLNLRDNPSVVSFSSPHIRYSLCRILSSLGCVDRRMAFWKASSEVFCCKFYPNKYIAQSFFSDGLARLSSIASVVVDFFSKIPSVVGESMVSVVRWITNLISSVVLDSVGNMISGLVSSMVDRVCAEVRSAWDKFSPVVLGLAKTLFRFAFDYTPGAILLELCWDLPVLSGVIDVAKTITAQGPEDIGYVFGALTVALFAGLGRTVPGIKPMSDLMLIMVSAAAAFNRSQLWESYNALIKWYGGDVTEARLIVLEEKYPRSIQLYRTHVLAIEREMNKGSMGSLTARLGNHYAGYLKERVGYGSDAREMEALLLPAVRYVNSSGIRASETSRCRPPVFMFWGDSNIGKSTCVQAAANAIATKHKDSYEVEGVFNVCDAVYNVNLGDDYYSGYQGQDIHVFDEWFQEKDSEQKPSASVMHMFNLVTTTPTKLNMAAVQDKGKLVNVSLILGATNMNLSTESNMRMKLKCIHSPEAVMTRLKYRVQVSVKEPYFYKDKQIYERVEGGARLVDRQLNRQELYRFDVTTIADKVVGVFDWKDLLKLIEEEYVACRDFVPEDLEDDVGWLEKGVVCRGNSSEKEEELINAQGWSWFRDWFAPKEEKRYFKSHENLSRVVPVDISPEFEEFYGGPDDEVYYRECKTGDVEVRYFEGEEEKKVMCVKVCLREKVRFDLRTIGFGLLLMGIVVAGVVPMARKLRSSVSEMSDMASVMFDGIQHWWNPKKCCYEAQGQLREINGKTYLGVYTKTGYKWYPQSAGVDMLSLLDNQRSLQQVPTIYNSVFSVESGGMCIGNAFALTDSSLLLPWHVAASFARRGGVLSNGVISLNLLSKNSPSMCGYVIEKVGVDCAVLKLESFKLNGVRNNFSKLAKVTPMAGLCQRVFRNIDGSLSMESGTYGLVEEEISYELNGESYSHKKKNVRKTNCPGFVGLCGAIYLNIAERQNDKLNGGIVVGYHLAANETDNTRLFGTFDEVTFSLSSMVHTGYPALDNPKNTLSSVLGFEGAKSTSVSTVFPNGRLGRTGVPEVEGIEKYGVALLKQREVDGQHQDPMLYRLSKLSERSVRDVRIPVELEMVADSVSAHLCEEAIVMSPDWYETFSGADVLPSVCRTTASGSPWNKLGPTKEVFCMSASELSALGLSDSVIPNVSALEMLEECERRLLVGATFESASHTSIKEEVRSQGKVDVGYSRLFSGAPGHEFLLQRKYFMGAAAMFLKKNMAVHSALGIDPDSAYIVHEQSFKGFKNPKVFTADFDGMDISFCPEFSILVARVIRSVCAGRVLSSGIVSTEDFIRAVLLRRLMFYRMQVGDDILEPKTGHPSGSFLTTLINIVAGLILFCYGLSKMLGCSYDDVWKYAFLILLGDDSYIVVENGDKYDLQVLVDAIADCGFVLTAADKSKNFRWFEPFVWTPNNTRSEYDFLGRCFTNGPGVLQIDRLSKMMMFCEEHRALEIWPQAILSYREEVARYHRSGQKDWCERLKGQMSYFGFDDLEEFLSMSQGDVVQRLLNTMSKDVTKLKVDVPNYNRPPNYRRNVVAQGPEDGESSEGVSAGDAFFMDESKATQRVNDRLEGNYYHDHMDKVNYAPADLFARPYSTAQGIATNDRNILLAQLTAPSAYFYHNFNAQAKLANTVFFRCTFCVKVTVASGPFVTGKLLLSFRPGSQVPADSFQASNDPCTEMDLSSARSAIIRFNQVMPGNWSMVEDFVNPVDITDYHDNFDFGKVSLWSLTAPSTNVPFTIYTWLEDVELRGVGFTDFTLTPQGPKARTNKSDSVSADYKGELERSKFEWKKENTPDWLNQIAASLETIGGCIESVEECILGPIADFAERVEPLAREAAMLYGFSVPPPSTHIDCYMAAANFAQAHMITNIPSVRLAVVQAQRTVVPRTVFGSLADEMSIAEVTSRMGVLGMFFWDGVNAPGTTLASWNVMPGVVTTDASGDGYPSAVTYVAGTFRMWRGSMRYRIAVAKTAFHTGMLEIVWQMGYNNAVPSSPSQDALSQRLIWDVTRQSSIEFEVPYCARTPFTQVYFAQFGTVLNASDLTTGVLYVNVINPLTDSSGVVPSAIAVVVYQSGGSDIEFAMPGRHPQISEPTPVPERPLSKRKAKARIVAQGGPFGDDETEDGLNSKSLGTFRAIEKPSAWAHMSTMGERVLSLRLLIKRFSAGVPMLSSVNFGTVATYNWYVRYLSYIYAFWAGSWRVNVLMNPPDFNTAPGPYTWTLAWNGYYVTQGGNAHLTLFPYTNSTVLEVPWYSATAFRVIGDFGVSTLEGPSPPTGEMEFAAGDDFSYGFQVGSPLVHFDFGSRPGPLY